MINRFWSDVREMLKELVEYRELLVQMTRRDLLLRYKQTVMGFGWAVFMPLINTVLFSVIFTRVAPIDVGMPYPLFAYTGLVTWNLFASSQRFAVVSLTANANLVSKIYFPREIFPFSAVIVSVVDFGVGCVVLIVMMAYYGIAPTTALLFLPAVLAVHITFTAGVALVLAMGNLFYRDVKYLFEVVLTIWMFATSVLYPLDTVGGHFGALMILNPMTPIIDAYRSVLLRGELPESASFLASSITAVVTFVFAWLVFHRAEFRFAESV